MENKEEEEDKMAFLNYGCSKGQLIKLLKQKMKKPEIDDSLGKILDQFSQITREQMTFLDNGVSHMNFAEDALLLQACGQYYGKRVDKLWNEMLEFHTRLIKHDEHAAKHCTNQKEREARKSEVSKLEERLNCCKRKKIRLVDPDEVAESDGEYFIRATTREKICNPSFKFFDEEKNPSPARVLFKYLSQIHSEWHEINIENEQEAETKFRSLFVSLFHHLCYRFKHFNTPNRREIIYDVNDPEEFNAREGRLTSCHYSRHLIAILRLSYVLRKKFLLSNKIRPDDPYENYRDNWEDYLKEFLDRENRKIQNMPQDTDDHLIMFFKALASKEELTYVEVEQLETMGVKDFPFVSFENVIVESAKEGSEGVFDPDIPDELYTPKPVNRHENHNEEYAEDDLEAEMSSLLENIPDNPDRSQVEDVLKTRPDSGYFGGGLADKESERSELSRPDHEIKMKNSSFEQFTPSSEMKKKIKEFSMYASEDHQEQIYKTLENCYFYDGGDGIRITYNKQNVVKQNSVNVKTLKTIKRKVKAEKNIPVKRRRLSQKIIAQLKQSVVATVKVSKFEYFYLLNYHPEAGEGKILQLNWKESVHKADNLPRDTDKDCTDEADHVNNEIMDVANNCKENECSEATNQLTRKSYSGFVTREDESTETDTSVTNTKGDNKVIKTASSNSKSEPLFDSLQKRQKEFGEGLNGVEPKEPDNTTIMTPRENEMFESRKRVAEWRAFITPKLRQLNDQDFDIHEYGLRIMNDMEINESRPFSDFVDGKSSSEVVRYFVSSLQLANTLNVEISGAQPGELSNDTLELKLLSKDRYHEHLQEFQAPSEKDLKEKLLKIKPIRQQNKMLKRKCDLKTANEAILSKSENSVKKRRDTRSKQVQNSNPQEPCSSQYE